MSKKTDDYDSSDGVLANLLALALLLPMAVWAGYALTILWDWFMVPLGVPAFQSAWHAAGFLLIASWASGVVSMTSTSSDSKVSVLSRVALGSLIPLIVLGLGWVYHSFM